MPGVLLDANAYRGLGRARFDALLEFERAREVTRYAEGFALTELLAHLLDPPESMAFRSCRAALVRMFRRVAGEGPCGIIRDSQSRLVEVVTGKGLDDHDAHTDQLRLLLMHVGHDYALSMIEPQLRAIASHVKAMEDHWTATMRALQQRTAPDVGPTQKDDAMRLRIKETSRVQSAGFLLRVAGQPATPEAVARVRRGAAACVEFGACIYDRVVFDRIDVEADAIRNLLWDQWLAFNVGQTIGPRPLWVVTDDRAIREAAEAVGLGDRVHTLTEYERWLQGS